MHAALNPRLRPMGDFLGHEHGEELAVGQALAFGAVGELGIEPPHGRQVQPAEQSIEVQGGRRVRHAPATAGRRVSCRRTYSAPIAPCSSPQSKAASSEAAP